MKLYWLPLLILSTQIILAPNAIAAEAVAAPVEVVEIAKDNLGQGQADQEISLDKGFHRRRIRRRRIQHRSLPHGRFHHGGRHRSGIVIIRQGSRYDVLRHGEFRRDHIFFRSAPFDTVHRERFRRDRFHHNRFYYNQFEYFDQDGFRLIIRSD